MMSSWTEIAAGLDLDQFQLNLARIFQPVDGADQDITPKEPIDTGTVPAKPRCGDFYAATGLANAAGERLNTVLFKELHGQSIGGKC
jgi:hypothetical protein